MEELSQKERLSLSSEEEQEKLGQRLQEARDYLGLSQELVAEHLGIPRASVSAMETGKRKVSSLELKQLSRLYRQSIEYFLGEEDVIPQGPPKDEALNALFRATKSLTDADRRQVLRFAQFLQASTPPPKPSAENSPATASTG